MPSGSYHRLSRRALTRDKFSLIAAQRQLLSPGQSGRQNQHMRGARARKTAQWIPKIAFYLSPINARAGVRERVAVFLGFSPFPSSIGCGAVRL